MSESDEVKTIEETAAPVATPEAEEEIDYDLYAADDGETADEEDPPEIPEEDPGCPPLTETGFAPRWRSFWRTTLSERKYLGLCFLFPALLLFIVYAARGVFPFGDDSVLVLDLNAQYVYFFAGLRRIVLDGGSLVYSFFRNMGGEFMGLFAYYLASPFSWLVLLFPAEHVTEALFVMFLLKTGCCGLTFGIYVEATRKRNRPAAVMFSVMYALCSYAVVMQHNTMWIDNLILLPLIMLGIEWVIKRKKYKLLIVTLALAILSNFYIGYMTCIFVIVYFFYYYFAHSDSFRNPTGERNHFVKSVLRMLTAGLIAVCIGMVILLPTYTSLQFGKSTFSTTTWTFTQTYDLMDMATKAFFGSYDTVRPAGMPFLFCGTLMLLLMPLYFFAPHIRTREKVASGLLILFFLISMDIGALDIVWHGLQKPNWLNHRYAFMLCFFLILLAFKAFEKLREIGYRYVVGVAAGTAVLLVIIQKYDLENVDDMATVWASLAFIVLYTFLLRGVTFPRASVRRSGAMVLVLAVCMEMGFSTAYDLYRLDVDVVFSSRKGYVEFNQRLQPAADSVLAHDGSFYRFEKTVHRKTNDNFALGIRGLSNSTSTLNASVIRFLKEMGMDSRSHWSKYKGSTPVLDALTDIRYIIADADDRLYEGYVPLWNIHEDDPDKALTVYENPYALSLAFGVSRKILELNRIVETTYNDDGSVKSETTAFSDFKSPFERSSYLFEYMLGDHSVRPVYRSVNVVSSVNTNLKLLSVVGHRGYRVSDSGSDGFITYTLDISSSDPVCLYIPSDYPRECKVYVDGASKGTIGGNDTNCVMELGSFEPGATVSVKLVLNATNLYVKNNSLLFYYFDGNAFAEQAERLLSSSQYRIESWSDTHFTGTIDVEAGRETVFTSIPFDTGWKVYCDGSEVETFKMLNTLLGFTLSPGSHQLELRYSPACLKVGGAVSLCGLAAFGLLCGGEWLLDRRRRKRAEAADAETDEPQPVKKTEEEPAP